MFTRAYINPMIPENNHSSTMLRSSQAASWELRWGRQPFGHQHWTAGRPSLQPSTSEPAGTQKSPARANIRISRSYAICMYTVYIYIYICNNMVFNGFHRIKERPWIRYFWWLNSYLEGGLADCSVISHVFFFLCMMVQWTWMDLGYDTSPIIMAPRSCIMFTVDYLGMMVGYL